MKIERTDLSWAEALVILGKGGAVTRPSFIWDGIPTAVVKHPMTGALFVVADTGQPLHLLNDPAESLLAEPWQECTTAHPSPFGKVVPGPVA